MVEKVGALFRPGQRHRVADDILGKLPFNAAALLKDRIKQRHEFRRERKLAVGRLPAGTEDEEHSLPDRNLDQRRIPVIEAGQNFGGWNLFQTQAAVLPKMDFRKVAERRRGEGSEERML